MARGFAVAVKREAVDADSPAVNWDWENRAVVKAAVEC